MIEERKISSEASLQSWIHWLWCLPSLLVHWLFAVIITVDVLAVRYHHDSRCLFVLAIDCCRHNLWCMTNFSSNFLRNFLSAQKREIRKSSCPAAELDLWCSACRPVPYAICSLQWPRSLASDSCFSWFQEELTRILVSSTITTMAAQPRSPSLMLFTSTQLPSRNSKYLNHFLTSIWTRCVV